MNTGSLSTAWSATWLLGQLGNAVDLSFVTRQSLRAFEKTYVPLEA